MAESAAELLARAADARTAAEAEPLANVREKLLVSAHAWEALANKTQRIAQRRAERLNGTVTTSLAEFLNA